MQTKDPNLSKTLKKDVATENATSAESTSVKDKLFSDSKLDANTDKNVKGNEVLEADEYDSEHVNDGDNRARQPDRRDQQGRAFDGGMNEANTVDEGKITSEKVTDRNRYSSIENAQVNALPTDKK